MTAGSSNSDFDAESMSLRCAACGYLLYGLPENRCPECGLAFEPSQRKTTAVELPPLNWRPLAQGILIAASVFVLAFQCLTFDPFDDLLETFFFWPIWVLLLSSWLFLLSCSEAGLARSGQRRDAKTWRRLLWLPAPVLFVVAVGLVSTQAPFRLQFRMSRSALARLEASVRGSKTSRLTGRWQAGSFTIEDIGIDTTSAYFQYGHMVIRHQNAGQAIAAGDIDLGGGWSAGRIPVS
jgi:hypothetical protein